jgi:hypothetical protein
VCGVTALVAILAGLAAVTVLGIAWCWRMWRHTGPMWRPAGRRETAGEWARDLIDL